MNGIKKKIRIILFFHCIVLGRSSMLNKLTTQSFYKDFLKGERELLRGSLLRASAFNDPPCFSSKMSPTGNFFYYGICNDILVWLCEYYDMKLIYIPANSTEIIQRGIISVLIKQMLNKEVDIIPYAFAPTSELRQQIDFSIPLGIEYYNLLQQWPKEESRITATIRPFSLTVWVILIFSFAAMVIFMAMVTYFDKKKAESKPTSLANAAIFVMTIITGQGNYLSAKEKFSLRLAVGVWSLVMIVLINAYAGTLTSYLTVPKLKPIVNTLTELATSTETEIASDFELEHTKMFLRANSGSYKVFGNTLRNNPKLLIKGGNIIDGMTLVLERGATYFTNRVVVQYLMAMDMQSHSNCRLTTSKPISYIAYFSAGLPKGSRQNWIINHDFQYLWDSGLLNYWLKTYTPNVDKCMTTIHKPRGRMTSFTLNDLSSAFVFLGIGTGLSMLLFFLEMIVALKKSSARTILASSFI